jgi:hypothetical protein
MPLQLLNHLIEVICLEVTYLERFILIKYMKAVARIFCLLLLTGALCAPSEDPIEQMTFLDDFVVAIHDNDMRTYLQAQCDYDNSVYRPYGENLA